MATTTTTLVAKTSTCPPDLHAIAMSSDADGDEVEPGSYAVRWGPPDFVFTVSSSARVWMLYDWIGFEIQPIPYPDWQPPRLIPFFGEFELMYS
jgi:hypothetical protein